MSVSSVSQFGKDFSPSNTQGTHIALPSKKKKKQNCFWEKIWTETNFTEDKTCRETIRISQKQLPAVQKWPIWAQSGIGKKCEQGIFRIGSRRGDCLPCRRKLLAETVLPGCSIAAIWAIFFSAGACVRNKCDIFGSFSRNVILGSCRLD